MDLKSYIADSSPENPDFPTMILKKILFALPSEFTFSLQTFINSWNYSEKCPRIVPNCDVVSLTEALLTNLPIKDISPYLPYLTKFLGSFNCSQCGQNYTRVKNWEEQIGSAIPILTLPDTDEHVDLAYLVEKHLTDPFVTRCGMPDCRSQITDGKIEPILGLYTILALNRCDIDNPGTKLLTKISLDDEEYQALLSIICHRGDVNSGHYVSYHKVDGEWYINDDSKPCKLVESPFSAGR